MNTTPLEKAVLEAMCDRTPNEADALRSQIETTTVLDRTNTGVGFYTKLKPTNSDKLLTNRVIGGVFANVAGLDNPVAFLLFTKDGHVDLLEGAATDESTATIDFAVARFVICD
jgi:hypothetical protein